MEFSKDATFYCPVCSTKMDNLQPPTADHCLIRCIHCAQTWSFTFNSDSQPTLTAISDWDE
jgi:hypothetical protein